MPGFQQGPSGTGGFGINRRRRRLWQPTHLALLYSYLAGGLLLQQLMQRLDGLSHEGWPQVVDPPPDSVGPPATETPTRDWARKAVADALAPWTTRGVRVDAAMVERTAAFEPYALRWSPREVVGWWAETCEHQPRLRFWKSSKMGSVGDTFVGYMARALQTQTWLRSELRPFRVPIEQGDWPYVLREAVDPAQIGPVLHVNTRPEFMEVLFPTFTTARNGKHPDSPEYLHGYADSLKQTLALAQQYPWERRQDTAVFRAGYGHCATGCGPRGKSYKPWYHLEHCVDDNLAREDDPDVMGYTYGCPSMPRGPPVGKHERTNLALLSHGNGSACHLDAGITGLAPRDLQMLQHHWGIPQHTISRQLVKAGLNDHQQARYKYIVHAGGNGFSGRAWRMLALGCTVLWVDNGYHEWWYKRLAPWVHYIPVRQDLSDLCDRISWARTHPAAAEQIARNGMSFVKNFHTANDVDAYVAEVMLQLGQMYTQGNSTDTSSSCGVFAAEAAPATLGNNKTSKQDISGRAAASTTVMREEPAAASLRNKPSAREDRRKIAKSRARHSRQRARKVRQ